MRHISSCLQHGRHQQRRQHNAQSRTAVIQPQQQSHVLWRQRPHPRSQQTAGNKHQRTGHTRQQPLHQERRRINKKPTPRHKHTGQQTASHQQRDRRAAFEQPRRGQRPQQIAHGVQCVHRSRQRVAPSQVSPHGGQQQAIRKTGDAQRHRSAQRQSRNQHQQLGQRGWRGVDWRHGIVCF